MHKKTKGAVAEAAVAAHLLSIGWSVLFPFGENHRYDLVAEKNGKFRRVQVKYVTPKNGALHVGCKSSNNWSVNRYTASQVDYISVYDAQSGKIYFVPSSKFNSSAIALRLTPTKNKQKLKIKSCAGFTRF